MKKALVVLLIFSLSISAGAEHLMGGKFSYKKINANTIEFTLELERDCASTGAAFENPLRVGLYASSTNLLLSSILLSSVQNTKYNYSSNCGQIISCKEIGRFVGTLNTSNISRNNIGYYLNWERCCMNSNNINLFDPTNTPYSAIIDLPSRLFDSTQINFNSPRTNNVFNPIICVNKLFKYKLNYTDSDGDSIAFRFIQPIIGGYTSYIDPGQNTGPKPYDLVTYILGYDKYNFIDATDTPRLNPLTGEISFTPTAIGSYVFGYAVDEFRNGQLIGTVYHQSLLKTNICDSIIIEQPQDQYVNINDKALFRVRHNLSNVNYQWQVSSFNMAFSNMQGETRDSLVFNQVIPSLFLNKYRCAIDNGKCIEYSYNVSLKNLSIGINNFNKVKINVYPNPSKGLVTLSAGNYNCIGVYSLDGKLIIRSNLKNAIDISALENGIYIIRAEDEKGQTYYAKVIKSE